MQSMSSWAARWALAAGLILVALPLSAEQRTSSDLLLPYFEVDLEGSRNTLFALGNVHDGTVEVRVSVVSDWGIPVVETTLSLGAGQVVTASLRDWLVRGALPTLNLGPGPLAHAQAALTGRPSPRDGLYYGSAPDAASPDLATGFVTFRILAPGRPGVLWGDYFLVDPAQSLSAGDVLVDIDRRGECRSLCDRHVVRYLEEAPFEDGTELVIWTGRAGRPSATPEPASVRAVVSGGVFRDEDGAPVAERFLDLVPTQLVRLSELGIPPAFGWIDIATDEPVYIGVRYAAGRAFSVALQSWCVAEPVRGPGPSGPGSGADGNLAPPAIDVETHTAGVDADLPTGPVLVTGSEVLWQYHVTNLGAASLHGIEVTDDRGVPVTCPRRSLAGGQSMTCTAQGTAGVGQYANLGTATGTAPGGTEVTDSDPSHYLGVDSGPSGTSAQVRIETLTDGVEADGVANAPQPVLGAPVTWTFIVTNPGTVPLHDVSVTDGSGTLVVCPGSTLAPGASMTCTATGVAVDGDPCVCVVGLVVATSPSGDAVTDSDPTHYCPREAPGAGDGSGGDPGAEPGGGSGGGEGGDSAGCTPGYWKQSHHWDSWLASGYSTTRSVASVFAAAAAWPPIGDASLVEALSFSGGPGVDDKAALLVHHAVAALLNAAHPGIAYPYSAASIVADTEAALAGGDGAAMTALKDRFDAANNLGCPLS